MVTLILSDELLRFARGAATAPVVRDAVRDLARHALRSRSLTAEHIASVARAVGEGIEGCAFPPSVPARDVERSAWAGLAEAIGEALYACELAARDLGEGWAGLSAGDLARIASEFEEMERTLSGGCTRGRIVDDEFRARLEAVIALLRRPAASAIAQERVDPPMAIDAQRLALVATGVLLGLTAAPRDALAS